jgi:hypothetical protein
MNKIAKVLSIIFVFSIFSYILVNLCSTMNIDVNDYANYLVWFIGLILLYIVLPDRKDSVFQ